LTHAAYSGLSLLKNAVSHHENWQRAWRCADAIRASISGSRVVILENTGHTPILECPARTARHHVEFLAGIG